MTFIAPSRTQTALREAPRISNLFLRLYTLVRDDREKKEWKHIEYAAMEAALSTTDEIAVLRQLAERQRRLAAALAPLRVRLLRMKLHDSDLTSGLSSPTLLENGMTLLRPYGIPIVAGSAVKGIAASWLAELLEGRFNLTGGQRTAALERAGALVLFGEACGEDGLPGKAVFFDALPCPTQQMIAADNTTVHYPAWYQAHDAPSGFENPVPIPFLTVNRGTVFQFCFAVKEDSSLDVRLNAAQDQTLSGYGIPERTDTMAFLEQLLVSAAQYKGFGSQTAVGYGRMEPEGAAR